MATREPVDALKFITCNAEKKSQYDEEILLGKEKNMDLKKDNWILDERHSSEILF